MLVIFEEELAVKEIHCFILNLLTNYKRKNATEVMETFGVHRLHIMPQLSGPQSRNTIQQRYHQEHHRDQP